MCGKACFEQRNIPRTLTRCTASQLSASCSAAVLRTAMPAQLTNTSSPPKLRHGFRYRLFHLGLVANIDYNRARHGLAIEHRDASALRRATLRTGFANAEAPPVITTRLSFSRM